ncbi:cysteine-rich motor neuron 1 protein-like [Clytia hemisphaerica]|uniref:IGFBP N-terminal domain-containing protein n=1 Tax=Clytia hemisphaerica TaxID=252671 RepID=A0A7M5VDI1_9CNID|eukprot:TCONS_00054800-protein
MRYLVFISISLVFVVMETDCLLCDPMPKCTDFECFDHEPECGEGGVVSKTLTCGCCLECAKQVNEECGGPYHYYGRCDHALVCVPKLAVRDRYPVGVCKSKDNALREILKKFR